MIPIFLLVVGILILITLTLYFIPVIAQIALGKTPESGYFLLQASWGVIGARTRMEGGESRQEFLIGERPFYSRTVKDKKTRAPEEEEELRKIPSLVRKSTPSSAADPAPLASREKDSLFHDPPGDPGQPDGRFPEPGGHRDLLWLVLCHLSDPHDFTGFPRCHTRFRPAGSGGGDHGKGQDRPAASPDRRDDQLIFDRDVRNALSGLREG